MSGSNEAIAHLQEKLEQARRLLQQVSDPTTTESLKALIADLESRLSDLLGACPFSHFGRPRREYNSPKSAIRSRHFHRSR
jgi:hypothetical protein